MVELLKFYIVMIYDILRNISRVMTGSQNSFQMMHDIFLLVKFIITHVKSITFMRKQPKDSSFEKKIWKKVLKL